MENTRGVDPVHMKGARSGRNRKVTGKRVRTEKQALGKTTRKRAALKEVNLGAKEIPGEYTPVNSTRAHQRGKKRPGWLTLRRGGLSFGKREGQ